LTSCYHVPHVCWDVFVRWPTFPLPPFFFHAPPSVRLQFGLQSSQNTLSFLLSSFSFFSQSEPVLAPFEVRGLTGSPAPLPDPRVPPRNADAFYVVAMSFSRHPLFFFSQTLNNRPFYVVFFVPFGGADPPSEENLSSFFPLLCFGWRSTLRGLRFGPFAGGKGPPPPLTAILLPFWRSGC